MLLPYRNKVLKTKNFKLNISNKYENNYDIKPMGLWYQIRYCLFEWGEMNWGNNIHGIKLKNNILNKPKGILSISNTKQLIEFHQKYKYKFKYRDGKKSKTMTFIKWDEVAKVYGGFEIKNFIKIKLELDTPEDIWKYMEEYTWFDTFDFSSGCIWDLKLIKEINYWGKLSKKEIDNLQY